MAASFVNWTSFSGGLRTGFGRTEYKCAPAVTIVSRYSSPEELANAERSRLAAQKRDQKRQDRRERLKANRIAAAIQNKARDARKAASRAQNTSGPITQALPLKRQINAASGNE